VEHSLFGQVAKRASFIPNRLWLTLIRQNLRSARCWCHYFSSATLVGMHLGSLESHSSVTSDRTLSGVGKCRIRHGVRVLLPGPRQSPNLQFIKHHDHVSVHLRSVKNPQADYEVILEDSGENEPRSKLESAKNQLRFSPSSDSACIQDQTIIGLIDVAFHNDSG
jgi:hypothetical protein